MNTLYSTTGHQKPKGSEMTAILGSALSFVGLLIIWHAPPHNGGLIALAVGLLIATGGVVILLD